MKKMTPIYILWGVVMCLQVAFIFRDTTHIVGYTLEFINPNDLQELSIPLVVKPDVYEPDTLVNTRTGEAKPSRWPTGKQSNTFGIPIRSKSCRGGCVCLVPYAACSVCCSLCGLIGGATLSLRTSNRGISSQPATNGCCAGSVVTSWRAWHCWPCFVSSTFWACGCSWTSSTTGWALSGFPCWPMPSCLLASCLLPKPSASGQSYGRIPTDWYR